MRYESNSHKELITPSIQNLKPVYVGIFFYILLNFLIFTQYEIRLTFGLFTISSSSASLFYIGTLPLENS